MSLNLPFITLEEHVFTNFMWDKYDEGAKRGMAARDPKVQERLLDIGDDRIAVLDANSIQTQILSHIPCHPSRQDMQRINDELHQMKKKRPGRYEVFACLSLNDPAEAAEELERCVKDLGFVGALFPNTLDDGTFYDTPRFYPLYAKAQELDVPLYLHPIFPTPEVSKLLFDGPYPKPTAIQIGAWCYGWHATVAIHILRLFGSGIFDKYPGLKLIIGHMGETLPFMLDRIIPQTANWPGASERKKELRQVWDENIWVTTSGMFALGPMECLLRTTKIDRILYSVDYPLEDNADGLRFMTELRGSGLVSEEDFHKIAYKNAKNLLRLE
ncbi:hypothetical protein BHE90_014369 [Fusarium euwallaceae]|uniref:Amidohydrolase-related domain-containing protein n=1 Tax=Fusarium euwallaceae TaxID=1147111 RepID=A0A430L6A9_9HYPO|nr:hypothetical protein BHE90_014369 [Fusarium euwallaceae]